ncbi:MAG: hypothetical protein H6867_06225 [Rhodospirillales bacterium]|nr:hypothetical protein [Rhodospirillales bacterium]MCB9995127.1 hypothetical protein [Rhodospirillales bacterium]
MLITITAVTTALSAVSMAQDSASEEPLDCPAPTPEAQARADKAKEMMIELERQGEEAAEKYAHATRDLPPAQIAYLEHMDETLARALVPYKDLLIIKGFTGICGFDIETDEWTHEAYTSLKQEKDAEKNKQWQKYESLMNAVDFVDMGLMFLHTSLETQRHHNEIAKEVTETLREGTLMNCDEITSLLKQYNPSGQMSEPQKMSLPPQDGNQQIPLP